MSEPIEPKPTETPAGTETGGTPVGTPPGQSNPAARTVLTGQKSEREIDLESQLKAERETHAVTAREKKERELKIAELEDALNQARHQAPASPAKKSMMAAWLAGEEI